MYLWNKYKYSIPEPYVTLEIFLLSLDFKKEISKLSFLLVDLGLDLESYCSSPTYHEQCNKGLNMHISILKNGS